MNTIDTQTLTISSIAADTQMGAVTLTVPDMDRSLEYYQNNIGLALLERQKGTAVLGAGERPLLILQERAKSGSVHRAPGLYHFALLLPSRAELARTLQHLIDSETPISGASDHLVSEALYLYDPDGHGIEIYRDRPREAWVDEAGNFRMDTLRMDVEGVLSELPNDGWSGMHADTIMGHVHLRVANVDAAQRFYTHVLGFGHMTDYPSASFVSAGGYHHHLGMNMWESAGRSPAPAEAAQMVQYEILLPGEDALKQTVGQVQDQGVAIQEQDDGWLVRDPSQNGALLRVA